MKATSSSSASDDPPPGSARAHFKGWLARRAAIRRGEEVPPRPAVPAPAAPAPSAAAPLASSAPAADTNATSAALVSTPGSSASDAPSAFAATSSSSLPSSSAAAGADTKSNLEPKGAGNPGGGLVGSSAGGRSSAPAKTGTSSLSSGGKRSRDAPAGLAGRGEVTTADTTAKKRPRTRVGANDNDADGGIADGRADDSAEAANNFISTTTMRSVVPQKAAPPAGASASSAAATAVAAPAPAPAATKVPKVASKAASTSRVVLDLTLDSDSDSDDAPVKEGKPSGAPAVAASASTSALPSATVPGKGEGGAKKASSSSPAAAAKSAATVAAAVDEGPIPDPIVPTPVPAGKSNRGARWSTLHSCLLIRTASSYLPSTSSSSSSSSSVRPSPFNINSRPPAPKAAPPRRNAAAFDLDGTLLLWTTTWASQLTHYQLYASSVITQLRDLHDSGHKLVLFSNQGGIRSALNGKTAARVRTVIDWLEMMVQRPINAVVSTSKKEGYHKPSPQMWNVAENQINGGTEFDLSRSFYVGDSAGEGEAGQDEDDPQGGVDRRFALNVGIMKGKGDEALKFYTPEQYFGKSDADRRSAAMAVGADVGGYETPPGEALRSRAALLGGYCEGPVMIILVGVQGSGKSTFCDGLVGASSSDGCSSGGDDDDGGDDGGRRAEQRQNWAHLSQDTIRSGKPGPRSLVESSALSILQSGRSVVIDRMHLTPDQREHFVGIARQVQRRGSGGGVPVHVIWFDVPKYVIARRVKSRRNHAGGVEGDGGARMAVANVDKLMPPQYDEGLDLIWRVGGDCPGGEEEVRQLSGLYLGVLHGSEASSLPSGGGASKKNGTAELSFRRTLPRSFALRIADNNNDDDDDNVSVVRLPSLTLGTMKMGKRTAAHSVSSALQRAGFTAVDTAPTYNNEEEVGWGLARAQSSGTTRHAPFVIIKIPKRATTPTQARAEVTDTLRKLNLSSSDLTLLHWPSDIIESNNLADVWSEMIKIRKEGLTKAIGVSNFTVGALRVLLSLCQSRSDYPSINQVERHPLLPQWDLVDFCGNTGIKLQAHTALGQGREELMEHPTVVQAAKETGLEVSQLLIGWNLVHGVAVVTKSNGEERQRVAVGTLELGDCITRQVMEKLDSIALSDRAGSSSKTKEMVRFVDPPFMYKKGAVFSFGDKWKGKKR